MKGKNSRTNTNVEAQSASGNQGLVKKQNIVVPTLDTQFLARLEAVDWFAYCGKPVDPDGYSEIRFVSSWKEASRCYQSSKWKDITLEARNVITEHLWLYHSERFNHWNIITETAKAFMEEKLYPKWDSVKTQHKLDPSFVHSVQWSILAAIMETEYSDCDLPSDFFRVIFTLYEAGRFPCGWVDGEWPQGRLVVL